MKLYLSIFCLLPLALPAAEPWRLPKNTVAAMRVSSFAEAAKAYGNIEQGEKSDKTSFAPFVNSYKNLTSLSAGPAWRLELANGGPKPAIVMLVAIRRDENRIAEIPMGSIVHKGDWLAFAESKPLAEQTLDVITSAPEGAQGFEAMPAMPVGAKGLTFHWWADPWVQLQSRVEHEHANKDEQETWKQTQRHGLTGVQAWSGVSVLPKEGMSVAKSFALAPPPREHSLKMLTTTPADSLEVPKWLAGAPNMLVVNANVPKAFKHIDRLMDDMLADGIDGTYREILTELKLPTGLNIDLEKSLYPHLGPRVYVVRYKKQQPRKKEPEPHLVVVFETDDVASVRKSFRTLMEPDLGAGVTLIEKPNAEIWRTDAPQGGNRPCLATVNGYAVYATDISFLEALMKAQTAAQLRRLADINRAVAKAVTSMSPKPCLAAIGGKREESPSEADRRVRDAIVAAFFDGAPEESPSKQDTASSMIERVSRMSADRVLLGVAHENGWSFTGTESLPDSK